MMSSITVSSGRTYSNTSICYLFSIWIFSIVLPRHFATVGQTPCILGTLVSLSTHTVGAYSTVLLAQLNTEP